MAVELASKLYYIVIILDKQVSIDEIETRLLSLFK